MNTYMNARVARAMSSLGDKLLRGLDPAPAKLVCHMPGPYPVELRFLVLSYQVGHLATCLFRRIMLGEKEGGAYRADAKLAIADIITQCRVLCLEIGFNYNEIEELGITHFEETAKDLDSGAREA